MLAGEGVRRIIASPYTRALQTAEPLARRLGLPVLVNGAVRERYGFKCDIGSPVADLQQAWPGHDFAALDEVWWPTAAEPEAVVVARASPSSAPRWRRIRLGRAPWWSATGASSWL